jgi:hypothetical protein
MNNNLEFRKQREFGEIISDTFLFIKQNFKPLLKVFFYLCGFFFLASILSAVMHLLGAGNLKNITSATSPMQAYSNMFSWSYAVVMLFFMATYTSITVSTLSYIAVYIDKGNKPPSPEEVWAYFKYYFLRVMGSSIPITILTFLAFICCIIPGIYVFPALSIFYAVMIFENGSFGYSFGRAFKLANKDWFATAGAMIIIWIITYAAFLIPSLPTMILGMISMFTKGPTGTVTTLMIISTVIQYLSYVFMMIPLIGVSLCYFNLAERLESGGLLARIETLGKPSTPSDIPEEY